MIVAEEVAGTLDTPAEGISGRVHAHVDKSAKMVQAHMDEQMGVVKSKLSRLESSAQKLQTMDAKIDACHARLDRFERSLLGKLDTIFIHKQDASSTVSNEKEAIEEKDDATSATFESPLEEEGKV